MATTDVSGVARELRDATARGDAARTAQLLTEHLAELLIEDADSVTDAAATVDIAAAADFPVLAVVHPQRRQLQVLARNFTFPAPNPADRMSWVYAMALARESGRTEVARRLARHCTVGDDGAGARYKSPSREWLVSFQLALTSLESGQLERASEELSTASEHAQRADRGTMCAASRVTFGYRALTSALTGATATSAAHLDRAGGHSDAAGGLRWSLNAVARAIIDVEEHHPHSHDAIADLDLVDDRDSFWVYSLLARTRYLELHGLPADSLSLIEAADQRYRPEIGSLAHDILVARKIEALVIIGKVAVARAVYEDRATDTPHCRLALLGLLCAEREFLELEKATSEVLEDPALSPAQRVQAKAFRALSFLARFGAIPEHLSPGIGFALSRRPHMRIALMFPPVFREALRPFMSPESYAEWECSKLRIRGWSAADGEKAFQLTPREMVLLRHIDQGLSYQEIAAHEHVSVNTVKAQLKSMYKKLGVSSRAEAAASGRRWHLLDDRG